MQCTLKVVRFYLFTIFCENHLPLSFQRTTNIPFWWIGNATEAVEFVLFLILNNCFPSTPHKTTSVIFYQTTKSTISYLLPTSIKIHQPSILKKSPNNLKTLVKILTINSLQNSKTPSILKKIKTSFKTSSQVFKTSSSTSGTL